MKRINKLKKILNNKDIFKNPHTLGVALFVLLILCLSIFYYISNFKDFSGNVSEVKTGNIAEEVQTTGRVESSHDIDLGFERSGRVALVLKNNGDVVASQDILAKLDLSDLEVQLAEAMANLKSEEAKLELMKKGARVEDVAVSQNQLAKANQDLANLFSSALDNLNNSLNKSDGILKQTDNLFSNPNSAPQLILGLSDLQTKIDVEKYRVLANKELSDWRKEMQSLNQNSSQSEIEVEIVKSQGHLSLLNIYLNRLMDALLVSTLSPSELVNQKSTLNSARTLATSELVMVGSLRQSIASQKEQIKTLESQLNLVLAGKTKEEIVMQEAQVERVKANVSGVKTEMEKRILRAPFAGKISKFDIRLGEIVSAGTPKASLISENNFEIKSSVSEIDVARIHLGDEAFVTLDSYGNSEVFKVKVISVDSSGTLVSGAEVYGLRLAFLGNDKRIKTGMMTNITIRVAEVNDVLVISKRAILKEGERRFAFVLDGKNKVKREIKIGIESSDKAEVISGLKLGEKVFVF